MAIPNPPPIQITVPKFLTSLGLPNGPTTSNTLSPAFNVLKRCVVFPTLNATNVIVPLSESKSARVRGILSPVSLILTITN